MDMINVTPRTADRPAVDHGHLRVVEYHGYGEPLGPIESSDVAMSWEGLDCIPFVRDARMMRCPGPAKSDD